MPKVKLVKARQDYPAQNIAKGDMYYVWAIRMQRGGITRRSKTAPRQSQLTLSEYKMAAHLLNEQIEDYQRPKNISDLREFRDELKDEADSLRDMQQEKMDNLPEGLQQSQTGEAIQERIDAVEAFIDELDELELEDDDLDPEDEGDFEVDADESKAEGRVLNSDGQDMAEWKEVRLEQYEAKVQELYDELTAISIDVS